MDENKTTSRVKRAARTRTDDRKNGSTTTEQSSEFIGEVRDWSQVVVLVRTLELENPTNRITQVFFEGKAPAFYQGTYSNAKVIRQSPTAIRWSDGRKQEL